MITVPDEGTEFCNFNTCYDFGSWRGPSLRASLEPWRLPSLVPWMGPLPRALDWPLPRALEALPWALEVP